VQHDVLFGELTVEEHLTLFGRFKGVPNNKLKEVTLSILTMFVSSL
jgi:ABC-type multidrug transport system ATPase subunit